MNILRFSAIAAVAATVALAGCSETTSPQDRSAGTGALVGAAGGALVGQAIGRNTGSTLVGAAGGALLGAAVGTAVAPRQQNGGDMCRFRDRNGNIYTAPCDRRY